MSVRRSRGGKRLGKKLSNPLRRINSSVRGKFSDNMEKRQAMFISRNKTKIKQYMDRQSKSVESERVIASVLDTERRQNDILTARNQLLRDENSDLKRDKDALTSRVFQQSDEIAEGTRKTFDDEAKKWSGWMLAGLVFVGTLGLGYYAYLTGNSEDDARNMYEFYQDEAEYIGVNWFDSRWADPDKSVPDHEFGEVIDSDWHKEYEALND